MDRVRSEEKTHIFIFEEGEDWKAFTTSATIDPWTGGFFDGLDLFYWRKSGLGVLHSDSTLPHEIAHRVLYERFHEHAIPLALKEGFAEYQARQLAFRYLRPRGYDVRIISRQVPPDQYIPVEQLVTATRYPAEEEKVVAFYNLSERLVNMLIEKHGWRQFRELLERLARSEKFSLAILKVYPRQYISMNHVEREFKAYAVDPKAK